MKNETKKNGRTSDKLNALVGRISDLENLIVKTSGMRGTVHIEDVDLWNDLRKCADEIRHSTPNASGETEKMRKQL
jgi:glutaredoxin 2